MTDREESLLVVHPATHAVAGVRTRVDVAVHRVLNRHTACDIQEEIVSAVMTALTDDTQTPLKWPA